MSSTNQIQLHTDCILNVPIQSYDEFTFIVNGEEFKTTRLVSDLLSKKISQIHQNEPTLCEYIINTRSKGNFSLIIKLASFQRLSIPDNELQFVREIIELLDNDSIMMNDDESQQEITLDNVFELITKHEPFKQTCSKMLTREIDFLSSHFYELDESKREELKVQPLWIIERVINNPKLRLFEEDQLLTFINDLYLKKSDYSFLYEFVIFQNINNPSSIEEFLKIFNTDDMTHETWTSISKRLQFPIVASEKVETERYIETPKKYRMFKYENNEKFEGIMNFLVNESNGNVDEALNITASSDCGSSYIPQNAVIYNRKVTFQSREDDKISWICFDFKEHRVIPSDYLLKSYGCSPGMNHPKTWIIEGSNDNVSWDTLDTQENCPHLNGNNLVHSFKIQKNQNKEYKYIRMSLTGKNWNNETCLRFESFEIYGSLL